MIRMFLLGTLVPVVGLDGFARSVLQPLVGIIDLLGMYYAIIKTVGKPEIKVLFWPVSWNYNYIPVWRNSLYICDTFFTAIKKRVPPRLESSRVANWSKINILDPFRPGWVGSDRVATFNAAGLLVRRTSVRVFVGVFWNGHGSKRRAVTVSFYCNTCLALDPARYV